jgi:ComF family protein
MGLISAILDLLFPPKCVFCSRILDDSEYWCDDCASSLLLTADGGRQDGEFYDFCLAPLYYTGSVRKSVLRYKFRGAAAYADAYGKILASCIREHIDVEYDIVSWVPLSSRRKRERGYDQAFLLASATAAELGLEAEETLIKPKDIKPQSELKGKDERIENISGAFEARDPELIKDKCVLLIDDIVTTGSTLEECAKELLKNGAKKVICAALARGSQS